MANLSTQQTGSACLKAEDSVLTSTSSSSSNNATNNTQMQSQNRPPSPPSSSQAVGCPVPHAKSQPLPPGHPHVPNVLPSSLYPPTDSRCIFYRSPEDLAQTPPLSRSPSDHMLGSDSSLHSSTALFDNSLTNQFNKAQKLDQKRKEANINPMPLDKDGQLSLDPSTTLVLASRNSQLALVQSSHVSAMLESRYGKSSPLFNHELGASKSGQQQITGQHTQGDVDSLRTLLQSFQTEPDASLRPHTFPITSMSTSGDQNLRSPLYMIGGEGKAIWTKELEVALEQGGVDAIVHCLKDVPTVLPKGLEIAAILEREDPRDAFVVKKGLPYKTLDQLPPGSVIGTSSIRRVAQLRKRYPHLVFSDVRGNLNTRLAKLDAPTSPYTALILAAAGLIRIHLQSRITAYLSSPVLLYSVGQGSLAIEVRTPPKGADPATNRDARIREMIRSIADWRSTFRAEAERALLRELEGGCSIPVGVESHFEDHDQIEGKRNESCQLTCSEDGTEGHAIPTTKPRSESLRSSSFSSSRSSGSSSGSSSATSTSNNWSGSDPETLGDRILATSMNVANRSIPSPEGCALTLDAVVVSLDGSRSAQFSDSRLCKTVEDAKALGIHIAQELANKRGARSILDDVERHRQMAEQADQQRRQEARTRKSKGLPGGEELTSRKEAWMCGQQEINLSIEVEAVKNRASSVARACDADCNPLEVDRRFVPRDDGQPKAWEV